MALRSASTPLTIATPRSWPWSTAYPNRRDPDDLGQTTACRADGQAGDVDFLRSVAETLMQLLMETGVDSLNGVGR